MATTSNSYTGNGSTVLFSFTFPYLDTTDIKVSLNGVVTTAYSLANATTVQFNAAPANGVAIKIYRVTSSDQTEAEFYPGSAIRSTDLNRNFLQTLYVSQETVSTVDSCTSSVNAALNTANAATATANGIAGTASSALTNSNVALATANTASTNASAAASTANTALSTANTASTNATNAVSTANTASANASTALSTASTANANASSAINAVSSVVAFSPVAAVANIPASPVNGQGVQVNNSVGIESFTPLAGKPAGFVGDSGINVKIQYSSTGSTWNWIGYAPNDSDTRYLKQAGIALGSATTPSLTFTGDTNTGIYSPGADQVAVSTNGTQRLLVDASGQIGIAAGTPSNTISLGDVGAISQDINSLYVGGNFTSTGGNFKKTGNYAQQIHFDTTSGIKFRSTSSTGTAGNAITWSESMRLTPSGRLGINTVNPSHNLEVYGSLCVDGFNDSSTNYITLRPGLSPRNGGGSGFTTEDHSGSGADGLGCWGHDGIRFSTAQLERARIDSSGRVGIGTTNPTSPFVVSNGGAAGLEINPIGVASAPVLVSYNRSGSAYTQLTYDGAQHVFNISATEKARIDSSGRLGIGTSVPGGLLEVKSADQNPNLYRLYNAYNAGASSWGVDFYRDTDAGNNLSVAEIKAVRTGGNTSELKFGTSSTPGTVVERFRIGSAGQLGIGGATYGTSGQVLTSGGASAAPTWSTISGTPAGAVDYFAMSSAPTGYLKANGAAISRSTYSALFTAIGTTFGSGDGSTTFNVPDLRGEFIRGWADGRAVDTGRTFGSAQGESFASHSHGTPNGLVGGDGSDRFYQMVDPDYGTIPSGLVQASGTGATGGTETRPRNIALLACIKF